MNNIDRLAAELKKNEDHYAEVAKKNFEDAGVLTEEEVETLDKMRNETQISVVQQDDVGRKSEVSIQQFVSDLEDQIVKTKTDPPIKLMDGFDLPDVSHVQNEMAEKVRSQVIDNLTSLTGAEVTSENFDELCEKTMSALKKMFNTDKLDSNKITGQLMRMPLSAITSQLPDEIVKTFCTEEDLKFHQAKAKEMLVTSLGYMIVTGPQMDDLSDYINHEHKKMAVLTRMAQCEVDIKTALTSDETIAEIVDRSKSLRSNEAMSYSEIIKQPDACSLFFEYYAVVSERTADAYRKLFEEFPDSDDRFLIQSEVDINLKKAEVYRSICNLDLFKDRVAVYLGSIKTDKRFSIEFMERQASDVIDRLNRSKIPISFPGYTGNEMSSKEVYLNYITRFAGSYERKIIGVVNDYNVAIKLLDHNEKDVSSLAPITHDSKLFANCVLIIMGRIAKYLSKNTSTKYDAILLDGYFKLLCMMPSDLFVINRMNKMLIPLMDYAATLPSKKKK